MERFFLGDSDEEQEVYEFYEHEEYESDEHEQDHSHMNELYLLRENDPSHTSSLFQLCRFSDNELSEAFRNNVHVKKIHLSLIAMAQNTTNWESLLRVLATRQITKSNSDAVLSK